MLQDVKTARPSAERRTRLQSVARAVQVLRYVAGHEDGAATLSEIARAMGTPLPTAYHLLATLVDEGMLVRNPKRGYRLGSTVGVLSEAFHREPTVPEGLLEPLRMLSAATGENCFLTGWRDGEITLLRSQEGRHGMRLSKVTPGFTAFAHARAAGKLLLAHLPPEELQRYLEHHPLRQLTPRTIVGEAAFARELEAIRGAGYAIDDGEFLDGILCVSAVARHQGTVVGAYSVSAPVERFRANRNRLIRAACSAARLAEAYAAETVAAGR